MLTVGSMYLQNLYSVSKSIVKIFFWEWEGGVFSASKINK